jgi:hypothetical protein
MKALSIGFVLVIVFASGCKRSTGAFPQKNADFPTEEQTTEAVKPPLPWPVLEPHPTDPSREPMMLDGVFFSQWRVIADFDGNGTLDIGVSEGEPADCTLVLYLRNPEGYKKAGDLALTAGDPTSIEHVNLPIFSRIWTSGHISSREILINYTELKNGMIVTNSTFPNRFELSWGGWEGDEEGDKLPNALDSAIFNNSSSPIWWETSVFTNGVFQWVSFRADIP